jgi:energy-coupling factor transport system ATP-binding protein
MESTSKVMIKVEGLSFSYDGIKDVLSHVSFSIEQGQYVTILGHNGSGKSTLAKLLAGLLPLKRGTIQLFDLPLNEKNLPLIRPRMGIIFQNPDNQFIGATVADDIAFGLENKLIPHALMQPMIEQVALEVGMKSFLQREPSSLSGGQKQRVAIAGILAMKPDLIIMDEATAMLDPKGKREIRELTLAMKKANPKLTLISITHDVEEAMLSDEIIVMNEGRIVMQDQPFEIFKNREQLQQIELEVPFVFRLVDLLTEKGMKLSQIRTVDDLVDALCR